MTSPLELIGLRESFSTLEKEYQENPSFLPGDGNCFYRAYWFGLLQHVHHNENAYASLHAFLKSSQEYLIAQAYPAVSIEMFYDSTMDFIETLHSLSLEDIHQEMSTGDETEYMIWYLRALTGATLKKQRDHYIPFVAPRTIEEFCKQEVDPMGKECEHVQIMALTECLQFGVCIEYLDGHADTLQKITIPETSEPIMTLLYRPGHYDLLYTTLQPATSGSSSTSLERTPCHNTSIQPSVEDVLPAAD